MTQATYSFNVLNHGLRFDFSSIGKRIISKSIIYREIDIPGMYSLALVDNHEDGSSDDTVVSDNGDMEKILVTVFQTFSIFFRRHPDALVAFWGSTASRTRLYRIAISHEWAKIAEIYNVWGITEQAYESFERNRLYIGFLFSLKETNIV